MYEIYNFFVMLLLGLRDQLSNLQTKHKFKRNLQCHKEELFWSKTEQSS